MDELIDRVSGATGVEPDTARKAIGIVLSFVQNHVTPDQATALFDKVPGTREVAVGAADDEGGDIMYSLMNAPATGLSGLSTQLTSAGLGAGQIHTLGREMFAFLRQHAGEGAVDGIVRTFPDLKQMM